MSFKEIKEELKKSVSSVRYFDIVLAVAAALNSPLSRIIKKRGFPLSSIVLFVSLICPILFGFLNSFLVLSPFLLVL